MADRIVLLRDGKIEQQGAPLDLFERPATKYVASFLGSPSMNFLDGELVPQNDALAAKLTDGTLLAVPSHRNAAVSSHRNQKIILGIRPEHISRALPGELRQGLAPYLATIDLVQPTGSRTYASFKMAGVEVIAELQAHDVSRPGEQMQATVDMNRTVIIDPATEKVISAGRQ